MPTGIQKQVDVWVKNEGLDAVKLDTRSELSTVAEKSENSTLR